MTMQSIKLHVSPRIKQPVSPIHDALAANAVHTRGFAGVRTSFSYKLGFGSLVLRASGGAVNGWRRRDLKSLDLATLGNLCLDIVLNVPSLPPAPRDERQAYMERLAATPPDKKYWEAGGNCNLAFAAARLGLSVTTLGFVGEEIYGNFLLDVIKEEGVDVVGLSEDFDTAKVDNRYETLLCWVLVDPLQRHGFCSHADFSDEPAFSWLHKLSGRAEMAIRQSKILFCNGYGFDELLPNVMVSALLCSIAAGSAVFFDPGPRGRTLFHGNTDQRRALDQFLMLSDALLFTSDEAESLTGIKNPILAGRELLNKGIRVKWVIIKMGAKGSMLITKSSTSCAPAFMVNVVDTVGCGDSYTAAIAYGFLHDMPPMNTLALANAVGAATATGCGAGRNVATMDKILEILRQSNINEDNEYWSNLISTEPAIEEISLLSTARNKGSDGGCLIHVPLQTVISQLIQKLESKHLNQNCCQSRAERVNEATEVDCH